jgi:hypothetical protein
MWSGEVSRRLREKREGDWFADLRPGLALFIAARGDVARHGRVSSSTRLQWQRGLGADAGMLVTLRRS